MADQQVSAALEALIRAVDKTTRSRERSSGGSAPTTAGWTSRTGIPTAGSSSQAPRSCTSPRIRLAQLRSEGRLDWDAPIASFLPDLDLAGILRVKGADRSGVMTVRDVMAHTSGLADYFEGKRPDGPTTIERAIAADFGWTVGDVIGWTRAMRPGTPGKGLYSDTGYQLLGALIERVDGRSFADAVAGRITRGRSGMSRTTVFGPDDVAGFDQIAAMRWGEGWLRIPQAMASVQADGGVVSTLDDGLAFVDALFDGRLFPAALLAEMAVDWHRVFFPLQYGTGIMRFAMPRLLTGFRAVPAFIGHSGT